MNRDVRAFEVDLVLGMITHPGIQEHPALAQRAGQVPSFDRWGITERNRRQREFAAIIKDRKSQRHHVPRSRGGKSPISFSESTRPASPIISHNKSSARPSVTTRFAASGVM
jgi:hypothetical protein